MHKFIYCNKQFSDEIENSELACLFIIDTLFAYTLPSYETFS